MQKKDPQSYPWKIWVGCVLAVGAVFLDRYRLTGRVWDVPADFLSDGGALGSGSILFSWLVAGIALIVGVSSLWTARRGDRLRSGYIVWGLLLLGLGILPLLGMRNILSSDAPRRIAIAAQPVITALAHYRQDNGEYPTQLGNLVPKYLAKIPSTGYGRFRELHYYRAKTPPGVFTGPRKADLLWETWVHNEPFALVVDRVPGGTLVYRPSGRYQDFPGGRRIPGTKWGETQID